MPKRGSEAGNRIFFDELVSLAASRLKASGAIRLEDRHGIIAFGDKGQKHHRRHPYRFQKRRFMVVFHLPEVRPNGQKSFGSSTTRHAA